MDIPFTEPIDIAFRSFVSVLILFIVAKIIGPRQIAQLTFYDYILGITAGSIAAAVAVDTTLPLWGGVIALLIYCYYRMFSKNITKMSAQNQKYLNWRYGLAVKRQKTKTHMEQRKIYHFYKCPQCRQKVRVPKGHGKICITCPKCKMEFVRKS